MIAMTTIFWNNAWLEIIKSYSTLQRMWSERMIENDIWY